MTDDAERLLRRARRAAEVSAEMFVLREVPRGLLFGEAPKGRQDDLVDEEEMLETLVDELSERGDGDHTEPVDLPVRRQLGEIHLRLVSGADERDENAPSARRTGEFHCSRCFLLRPERLLGDVLSMRCVDCV